MARFNVGDEDKFGGQGGGGFFSLKNDKDVARVRFLYSGVDDVDGFSVHQIEVDGKKRFVNCLRDYGEPVDSCPFCAAKMFTTVKYFIPLYNIDADQVQVWERGRKFGSKITSICSRYPNVVSHVFEIERNGRSGDQQTTYEIFETGEDKNVTLDDFEVPNPVGTVVMDKTADEMREYLKHNSFDDGQQSPITRRNRSDDMALRRTPSGGDEGRREAF